MRTVREERYVSVVLCMFVHVWVCMRIRLKWYNFFVFDNQLIIRISTSNHRRHFFFHCQSLYQFRSCDLNFELLQNYFPYIQHLMAEGYDWMTGARVLTPKGMQLDFPVNATATTSKSGMYWQWDPTFLCYINYQSKWFCWGFDILHLHSRKSRSETSSFPKPKVSTLHRFSVRRLKIRGSPCLILGVTLEAIMAFIFYWIYYY